MPTATTKTSRKTTGSHDGANGTVQGEVVDTTVTPDRSPSQRMDALRLANAIRTERATLKRDLKAGRIRIDQVLSDPPEFLHTAKVSDIMLAVPRYGRVKVAKVLQRCRISPSKTVAGLSERQRTELIDALHRP